MGESKTSSKATVARVAAGGGAVLSLGASLLSTAAPAGAATFNVTTTADSGAGSLRDAIAQANAAAGPDTITFQAGLGTIGLTTGEIAITDDLTITDPEADVTVDAGGTSRIFYITNAGAVTISGLTLTDGNSGSGGAVYAFQTDLTVADSTITGNTSGGHGGGVFVESGAVTVTDSTFSGNEADDYGGGLAVYDSASATVTGSTFTGNTSVGDGGGGASFDNVATVSITDTTLADNDADDYGGGVFAYDLGSVTIAASTFSGNTVNRGGGGASVEDADTVDISGSTFDGNAAGVQGGGLLAADLETLTVTTSTFAGNSVANEGPALGGGIAADNVATATITESTVSGNDAGLGGGIASLFSDLTVTNATISGNTAVAVGGGIAFIGRGNDVAITHSTITGNEAGYGGGVFLDGYGGTAVLDHDILDGNVANGFPVPAAGEPTFDELGSAIFVGADREPYQPQLQLQALDSVTLTNNLVNGTIAGEVVDGGGNLFNEPANLGPLADNGGPTQTHNLLAGSAALDAGDAAFAPPPATDQRGLPRVANGRIDIGAVEVQVQVPDTTTTTTTPPAPPAQPVPASPTFTG